MTTFNPVDAQFFAARRPVEMLMLGADASAIAIRAVLEDFGAVVLMHLPGTPEDILRVLDPPDAEPSLLLIIGHGDERGFIVGEFATGLGFDTSMLVGDALPAAALAGHVHLPGWTVLSVGCMTGSPEIVAAFLAGGVGAYLAPDDYPDGPAATLFAIQVMYGLLVQHRSIEDAWRQAAAFEPNNAMYALHTPSGMHRLSG